MTISDPARRPAGTRCGGQFAAATHAEAPVDLQAGGDTGNLQRSIAGQGPSEQGREEQSPSEQSSDEQEYLDPGPTEHDIAVEEYADQMRRYNDTGTYSFPPEPLDPVQVVHFWQETALPDAVLAQFQDAYPQARVQQLTNWLTHAMVDDPAPKEPEILGKTKKYLAALAVWEQRRRAKVVELAVHVGPPVLAAHEVRPALRRVMTSRQLAQLPPGTICEVTNTSVEDVLHDVDGGPTTYGLSEQFYAAGQMPDSVFRDPSNDVGTRMAELSSVMNAMHGEIAALRDSQELDAATRGARNEREFTDMARSAGFVQR